MPENNDKNTDKLKDQKETSNEKKKIIYWREIKDTKIDYLDL